MGISRKKATKAMDENLARDLKSIEKGARDELSSVAQDYLRAIVDTRNAKKTGVPTLLGGDPGETGVDSFTQKIRVSTGTQGYGFLAVNVMDWASSQNTGGPFQDGRVFTYTGNTFTGDAIPQYGSSLGLGTEVRGWKQSPYSLVASYPVSAFSARLVGLTIEIMPQSAVLSQNGRIVLYEPGNHYRINATGATNLDDMESFKRSRTVYGPKTGSRTEKVVLNWHPRASQSVDVDRDDLKFHGLDRSITPAAGTMPPVGDLIVGFYGDKETSYECIICGMWEVRGTSINDTKPRLVDSRGMDLVFNTFRHKTVSGYVGNPNHVFSSYLGKAWEVAKKLGRFVSRNEKDLMNGAVRASKLIAGFI